MLRFFSVILVLSLVSTQNADADPPPFGDNFKNKGILEASIFFTSPCEGKSDLPHISRHKPGTVNVQARTRCPGKYVEITTRLTRVQPSGNISTTHSKHGTGLVTVNASLPCIWKKGKKKIKYEVASVHRLWDGQIGYTYNYNYLEC